MTIGILTITLHIPACSSLKEKRSRIKPLIARLRKEFNLSVAETEHHDVWQSAVIVCVLVSNGHRHTQRSLQKTLRWVETNWPDVTVMDNHFEII
jgi:hypothetical protein